MYGFNAVNAEGIISCNGNEIVPVYQNIINNIPVTNLYFGVKLVMNQYTEMVLQFSLFRFLFRLLLSAKQNHSLFQTDVDSIQKG